MKKLIGHIILFCIPILLMVILFPISRRQLFNELKDDCFNHGIWVHDRLYKNDRPIDLAFFGSSHTINGINDKLIDSLTGLRSANLGYCRLGMNLNQVLIEDLMKTKKPKVVFIEVRENEDRYSHPIFPNLAKSRHVLLPYLFFNRDMVVDMKDHLSYRLQLSQDLTFGKYAPSPILTENFGVASSPDTANSVMLADIKKKRHKEFKRQNGFALEFHMKYPKHYLQNIGELLEHKKVKIVFLFLPSYGSYEVVPNLVYTYKKYGEVWIAPKAILEDPVNWFDENHLNKSGANTYSRWLSEVIRSKLK